MNNITLLGRLTKDVNLSYSKNNVAYSKTSLAVNDRRSKSVLYIDLVFFNKLAEIANQYLKKGSQISVNGRLNLEQYKKDNISRQSYSVVVQDLEMLGSPDYKPEKEEPFKEFKPHIEIDEEEIPF